MRQNNSDGLIAGVDEAGRGSLFGPLVVAAVILPRKEIVGLKDSKQLSPKRREIFFREIIRSAISWSFSLGSLEEIEEKNVLRATLEAMGRAIKKLNPSPYLVMVDGPFAPEIDGYLIKPIIHGDRLIPQISAASILAKVIRDRIISRMSHLFPGFGLEKNMGYGTMVHRRNLSFLGPTPFHRGKFVLKYTEG